MPCTSEVAFQLDGYLVRNRDHLCFSSPGYQVHQALEALEALESISTSTQKKVHRIPHSQVQPSMLPF